MLILMKQIIKNCWNLGIYNLENRNKASFNFTQNLKMDPLIVIS